MNSKTSSKDGNFSSETNGNLSKKKYNDRNIGCECGIFGIASPYNSNIKPALETYIGLFSLQHRGQEAAGIAVNNCGDISFHKDTGLLADVFTEEKIESLVGNSAIGHVRYSTTGGGGVKNAQPILVSHIKGNLAIVHNGNLTNAKELREEIELSGGLFHTTSDSEIIAHVIVHHRLKTGKIELAIKGAMKHIKGAYSMIIMSPKKVIAVRDPNGFRPLVIGKLDGHYIFASETCAIDVVGGEYVRDVKPGEIVIAENDELRSIDSELNIDPRICVFEYIYLSRPDSIFNNLSINKARNEMGKILARDFLKKVKAKIDVVIPVPDSGIPAATGFAEESKIPLGTGLIKNRYIARTFISPTQEKRERQLRLKLNTLRENIKGKSVVLIDDSIVRGTTSKRIVEEVRQAGAKEVHMCISSPPFKYPCYFGIDVPDKEKLIGANYEVEEIKKKLNLNSLLYLSIEDLRSIFKENNIGICDGCFTDNYPVDIPTNYSKDYLT